MASAITRPESRMNRCVAGCDSFVKVVEAKPCSTNDAYTVRSLRNRISS